MNSLPKHQLFCSTVLLVLSAIIGTFTDVAANELYTIYEIQYSDASYAWGSPHAGEIIDCVGGIVTAKFSQRIVIQDPSADGEWAAIEIRGYPVYPTGIEVGDNLSLETVYVDEYRGATVLQYYAASSHTIISSGNPLPEPLSLSINNIRYPATPSVTEKYAAMLISIDELVRIGEMDLGGHNDNYEMLSFFGDRAYGSDYANNDIQTTYYVQSGERYQKLVGLLQRYDDDESWDYYQLLPRNNGDYELCSADVADDPARGNQFSLTTALPNPFVSSTSFQLFLSRQADVLVEIIDVSGRCITCLSAGQKAAGIHDLSWSGRDALGGLQPQGVYFIHVDVAGQSLTHRLVLAR